MGIRLALQVLEGKASGGRHGGRNEAIDELIRESFWMTDDELARAGAWAIKNDSTPLVAAMAGEAYCRRHGGPGMN
jgi:hypothetical protein